jgi:hypothetical protein
MTDNTKEIWRQESLIGVMLLIFMLGNAVSQTTELTNFNIYRNQVNQTVMLTLGGWALGNITIGTVLYYRPSSSTKYFHQLNLAWNLVNLGIAGFGYYSSIDPDTALTIAQSLQEQSTIEKSYYLTRDWISHM